MTMSSSRSLLKLKHHNGFVLALVAALLVLVGLGSAAPDSDAAARSTEDSAPPQLPFEPFSLAERTDRLTKASISGDGPPDRSALPESLDPAGARRPAAHAALPRRPLVHATRPVFLTTRRLRL